MNILRLFLFLGVATSTMAATAELRKLEDIFAKATVEEKNDPNFLLKIDLAPATDPKTGKKAFKIMRIEKGSVFEREGLKVGDLLLR